MGDEHRVDEIARCELGLADEAPERAGGAQPTQASLRERHGPDPEYPGSLDDVPELDPPSRDESRLDVRVVPREPLGRLGVRSAEHDRRAAGRVAERARHHDPVIVVDPGEVSLPVRAPAVEDVLDVVVEEDVMGFWHGLRVARYALPMADLQKRGGYTPRRAREQRAYRLVVTGGVAGVVGVVGLVLAVAGVIGATVPVIALIIAAICVVMFRSATSR